MTTEQLDLFARRLASERSRRGVLKGVAGGLALMAFGRSSGAAQAQTTRPGDVILRYYDAVQKRDWPRAYRILGSRIQSDQSYDSFVRGYAKTHYAYVEIGNVLSAGKIEVEVFAWLVDGASQRFAGTYTVGTERGVNRILSADIKAVDASGVPPLCMADQLSASVQADAGTGHRFARITVMNDGDVCELAGMPRVSISAADGTRLISGKRAPQTTVEAVMLKQTSEAFIELDWTNWCGEAIAGDVTINVTLGEEIGRFSVAGGIGVPPCLGEPESASTLNVKPWQLP